MVMVLLIVMYLCSNGVLDVPHDATVLCIPLSYGSKTSKALYELALPQTQLYIM
jgi:hypothetical protein